MSSVLQIGQCRDNPVWLGIEAIDEVGLGEFSNIRLLCTDLDS
jgi:hypothetical protein